MYYAKPFKYIIYIIVVLTWQIVVEKDQRVPADLVLLRTTERSGACFVRTDQLDGETDWKLRLAVPDTQKMESNAKLFEIHASLFAEKPQRDIHAFIGTFTRVRLVYLTASLLLCFRSNYKCNLYSTDLQFISF